MVNNILVAVGEPFHVPRTDFATINGELPVPLEFSLEGLGPGSVQRFVDIERPEGTIDALVRDGLPPVRPRAGPRSYASLSALYADIRQALERVPDLFAVRPGRGGGEHHLFLRESIDRAHPDYQMEVDDLSSALFAIDVVTEQGEGGILPPEDAAAESHYGIFLRISRMLAAENARPAAASGGLWKPAYPVVRNPTMRAATHAAEEVTSPDARELMDLFNRCYAMSLQLMVQHFNGRPDAALRRSDLMNAALDLMVGTLRPLAETLVTVPSGRNGTTAGPSFEMDRVPEYIPRPDVAAEIMGRRFAELAADCRKSALVADHVTGNLHLLAEYFTSGRGSGR
jgi:hypothetical protein